jgi:hypothetical protein
MPSSQISVTSGAVVIPAGGTEKQVFQMSTVDLDEVRIIGTVGGTGPLTDFRIASIAAAPNNSDVTVGQAVTELSGSGGDFATATSFLTRCTTTPHTTASGGSFGLSMKLNGAVYALRFFAKSTAGATLTIDASGVFKI